MKKFTKFIALFLVILTLCSVAMPAMALSGGYGAATEYLSEDTLKKCYGKVQAVKNLQIMLKSLGFNPGSIDGIYGNGTASAVTAFQEKYGTKYNLDADGQCGRYTKIALWDVLTVLPSECVKVQ